MSSARPTTIGPYELLEPLGRGGMGVVYRAIHGVTGRSVAIKTVRAPTQELLKSLRREIHALARLRHPGIVRILDEGVQAGMPWYAMELLDGVPLSRYRAEHRTGLPSDTLPATRGAEHWWTLSLSAAPSDDEPRGRLSERHLGGGSEPSRVIPRAAILGLARQLCTTLSFLHGEGIVHRDLKPDNILIVAASGERRAASSEQQAASTSEGDSLLAAPPASSLEAQSSPFGCSSPSSLAARSAQLAAPVMPVLVDFGLAARFAGAASREALEVEIGVSGTLAYIAPEVLRGEPVDARADLYSLGCILYQLLTGRTPFIAPKAADLVKAHLRNSPVLPSQLVPGLPEALDALVIRLLAKNPWKRLGYADDVAAALAALGAEEGPPGPKARAYLYRPQLSGREEPVRTLETRLKQLEAGTGGLLLIGGESGVGKTRLMVELGRSAASRFVRVLAGECSPAAVSEPGASGAGAPVLQALRKPLQAIADRCRASGIEETEQLFGRRGKLLALYEPALAGLPGQEKYPQPSELPAEAALLRLNAALMDTFAALAKDQPLLLMLDDLHWADELTIGFLGYWLRAASSREYRAAPVLVVGTYRTEEVRATRGTDGTGASPLQRLIDTSGVVRIALERLDAAAVAAIAADMLALLPPPAAFVSFLARHSEGNPFFVAEYLRVAIAEGVLSRSGGRWQVAQESQAHATASLYESLPLPQSLRETVERRLATLSNQTRRLLEAAAVLGREMDEALLLAVAGSSAEPWLEAIEEARSRDVLEETKAGAFRFGHDKLREVAYEQIPSVRKIELHRSAAVAIETRGAGDRLEDVSALGLHWERAGSTDRARPYYLQAARLARNVSVLVEADRLYRAYLSLVETPTRESIEARIDLGYDVMRPLGRRSDALEAHRTAIQEARAAGETLALGKALWSMGILSKEVGELNEAHQLYEQALEISRRHGDPEFEATVLDSLGLLCSEQGQSDRARGFYEEALQIDRRIGDRQHQAFVLHHFAFVYLEQGEQETALAHFEEALAIQRALGLWRNESHTLANLGNLYSDQGNFEAARECYEKALVSARRQGEMRFEAAVQANLGELCVDVGRPEQARDLYERAQSIHVAVGDQRFQGTTSTSMAALERRMGRFDQAAALLEQAEPRLRQVHDLRSLGICLCERGHLALVLGLQARPFLDEAVEIADELRAGPRSELGQRLLKLRHATEDFEASRPLFRGERWEDIPEGLQRWLGEAGQAGVPS